jgi:hypothetical protein
MGFNSGFKGLNDLDVQENRVWSLISTCGDYDEGGRGTGFSSSISTSGMFIFLLILLPEGHKNESRDS